MGSLAAPQQDIEQVGRTWDRVVTLASRFVKSFHKLAVWLNGGSARCAAVVAIAYMPLALLMAHATRLSSDEIYTYRIAQLPTIAVMIRVSREIDLHPPLHYLLQRWSLMLGLPRWLGSRLPSLLAGQVGLLAIFFFFSRRNSRLVGLLAAALYWFSPATDFSWSNRPYAIWLCLLAVSALLWEMSGEWDRRWWVPVALGAAGLAMVLDYMFGLACIAPFLAAEGVRSYRRQKIDWPVVVALLLPCVAGATYIEQVRTFATNSFSQLYIPSLSMGIDICIGLALVPAAVLLVCVFASKIFGCDRDAGLNERSRLRVENWMLMCALAALPIVLLCAAGMHHTQFFARYAACGAVGLALLLTALVTRYSDKVGIVAVLMAFAMLIASVVRSNNDTFDLFGPWRATQAMGVPVLHMETLDASVPVVVASATDFTEMNDREPLPVAQRLYYLTNRDAAQRFSGQTLFETEDNTVKLLGLPGHAEALPEFLGQHRKFYVVGDYMTPEQWVMRYLMAHGSTMQYMGKYASTTVADDLYLVTLPEEQASASR